MANKPNSSVELPYVSVIIPVYNAEEHIISTLKALKNQTYPRNKYEIILIDNGSTDGTVEILENENYTVLRNYRSKNPYISRNLGVKSAKGEIIVFLDITCTPVKEWLEEGVKLLRKSADLVGGNIKFKFSSSPTLGEWYDSITFVNVEEYINKFQSAVGGNLFIKRDVWQDLGAFPEDMRSGVDGYWTRLASSKGYNLLYGEGAIAYYPARDLPEVLKKSYRVGKGHVKAWIKEEKIKKYIFIESLKTFSPPSIKEVEMKIKQRGVPEMRGFIYHLWFISWINKIAMGMGRMAAMLNKGSDS